MGKTRTKIIDDSQPKKGKPKDELVEKLKAELGMEEEKKLDVQSAKPTSKVKHPTSKTKPRSKKYQQVSKDLDRSKTYSLDEAIELTKKLSYTKFDGTLEAHINTIQNIRGLISLPFMTGKTEYKTESKAPVIHLKLGKLSQPSEELISNVKILLSTIGKTKIKKVSLSPTMGPSVRIDLTSL